MTADNAGCVKLRPRLLDLFCGAGGAAVGYARAGFEVIGIDIKPQPHYPFEFHQHDALKVLALLDDSWSDPWQPKWRLSDFDAIHASPPCQAYANVTGWRGQRSSHPDLLEPTIALLKTTGLPWVVENVPEARDEWSVVLCGSQFGLDVKRHRAFMTSWDCFEMLPPCSGHRELRPFKHKDERDYADAMGCDWMNKTEARQAIPPAYTEYIGGQLLALVAA